MTLSPWNFVSPIFTITNPNRSLSFFFFSFLLDKLKISSKCPKCLCWGKVRRSMLNFQTIRTLSSDLTLSLSKNQPDCDGDNSDDYLVYPSLLCLEGFKWNNWSNQISEVVQQIYHSNHCHGHLKKFTWAYPFIYIKEKIWGQGKSHIKFKFFE